MFKFGWDNPSPTFQAKLREKLRYMAAKTTNELQTQLEYNAIALSGQARKSGQGAAAIREYRVPAVVSV